MAKPELTKLGLFLKIKDWNDCKLSDIVTKIVFIRILISNCYLNDIIYFI